MKENKYDDLQFFQKYSEMDRSIYGLSGAGEWTSLQSMLPGFKGKYVLDLGCGYGWHCKYAIDQGAAFVLGCDLSEKMLEIAKTKNNDTKIEYQCTAIEDLHLPQTSFDLVISSLAIHYIEDYRALINNIHLWLRDGGEFIFSVEHPIFTAEGSQDWIYNDQGEVEHFPVDNYSLEGKRHTHFLGEPITKYHRTLTTYLNTLLENGFTLQQVCEPIPPESMMTSVSMRNELRRPMMLLVSAKKICSSLQHKKAP